MEAGELEAVRAGGAWRDRRTTALALASGTVVVVKAQRPPRAAWRAWPVDAMASLFGLPWLKAARAHGGARGQAVEVGRLQALAAAGVAVPRLLFVAAEYIVMEHVGESNLADLLASGGDAAFGGWCLGLECLVRVHASGQCLSQAFARNFVVHGDRLAMIDFEDDPLETMSIDDAQARDWFAYLHSTVWLLRGQPLQRLAAEFATRLADERPEVRRRLETAGRRLSWMRRLPRSRERWGREVVGLQALACLLSWSREPAPRRSVFGAAPDERRMNGGRR